MPQTVTETEHHWIEMPDGVRLSARIWWPDDARLGTPCPALLEYIPYRKRDLVRARDERNHPYFAAKGYVCLRVDMRGSGDSEGTMPDMYSADERTDARHVIEWIAAQDWSNGRVGMFGTSWGGTASLQAAVDAPGPLKAVLANCATIDRFEDDIHWMGGCLLTDTLEWGATLPAILAAPPDAATVGPAWRDMWQARLETLTQPLEAWLRHRTRGHYWRTGSTRFDADRLTCPILAIGGWSDRYSNSVMPLVRARPDLCWGIVGPWGHHFPDVGTPGPAIGFQDLACAWWDHWLKSDAPGPLNWPRLRLWERGFDPPQDTLTARAGVWVETDDPAPVLAAPWQLGRAEITAPGAVQVTTIPYDLDHGQQAGETGYFGRPGGLPLDQTAEDARALCFDLAPLASDLCLTGHAHLELSLRRSAPEAQLVCRLCDLAPDGRSNLVTRTILNLALDDMLDTHRPFSAQDAVAYRVTFPTASYRFAAGHRIRIAVAASYWPLVWPSPDADIEIDPGEAVLHVEQLSQLAPSGPAPFPEARTLPAIPNFEPCGTGPLRRGPAGWDQPLAGHHYPQIGVTVQASTRTHHNIAESPTYRVDHHMRITRADGVADFQSHVTAEGFAPDLTLSSEITATWNDVPVLHRSWRFTT